MRNVWVSNLAGHSEPPAVWGPALAGPGRRCWTQRSGGSPGLFSVERQRDIDVGSQRLADGRPVLVASHERLPGVEMSRLVKVAIGHVRVMLEAGHREQIVAIGSLPDVDEVRQLFA